MHADGNVDAHLNQSTAGNNEVLSWTGSDYAWVAQSGGGGGTGDTQGSVFGDDSTLLVDGVNSTINSSALTKPISIPDGTISSNFLAFGDDDDLKIFHNGSSSIITETNLTSSLILRSYQDVRLADAGGSETMLKAISHGAVELYHNNVKKLETTADGISVTDHIALACLLYTSPSPRDATLSRMPSSA